MGLATLKSLNTAIKDLDLALVRRREAPRENLALLLHEGWVVSSDVSEITHLFGRKHGNNRNPPKDLKMAGHSFFMCKPDVVLWCLGLEILILLLQCKILNNSR